MGAVRGRVSVSGKGRGANVYDCDIRVSVYAVSRYTPGERVDRLNSAVSMSYILLSTLSTLSSLLSIDFCSFICVRSLEKVS